MFNEVKMKKIVKKIIAFAGYQLVPRGTLPLDVRQMNNVVRIREMFNLVAGIDGDIVECGVGKGRTFLYFSHFAKEEGKNRRITGFDSFEGFPEPTPEDASARNPRKGEWSGTSPEDILILLKTAGLSAEYVSRNITLIKGYVEDTLSKYDGSPIALLHIDLDLYSAYKHTLDALVPFVARGGIVLFDEYGTDAWPGATKAVDEYLADKPWRLQKQDMAGKYYFIKE